MKLPEYRCRTVWQQAIFDEEWTRRVFWGAPYHDHVPKVVEPTRGIIDEVRFRDEQRIRRIKRHHAAAQVDAAGKDKR